MFALGMTNLLGSFISCYPVTGSFSRSAVNNSTGARSQCAGLFTCMVICLTLLIFCKRKKNLVKSMLWYDMNALSKIISHLFVLDSTYMYLDKDLNRKAKSFVCQKAGECSNSLLFLHNLIDCSIFRRSFGNFIRSALCGPRNWSNQFFVMSTFCFTEETRNISIWSHKKKSFFER